jgi:polyferredoxin
MKLIQARRVSQAFFFLLFLWLVIVADLRWMKGYPASLYLELDPLVGISTVLATGELYKGLLWGLVVLIPTFLLGRIFCGWVCPYGTLHHFTGWALGNRTARWRIQANRYRPLYQVKYIILIAMLTAALLGSLQVGLIDPLSLFHRSMAASVLPAVETVVPTGLYTAPPRFAGGWVIGFILVGLVAANVFIPRFFCRALCPLGAFLGICSRFALWRIERSDELCEQCRLCSSGCEGAADPHLKLRKSECMVCFNCMDDCPNGGITFAALPPRASEVTGPELPDRRAVLAIAAGLAFFAFGRSSGASDKNFNKKVIRPPGAVPEGEFLRRCIKCDQCLRVCPTNVLQPAAFEAGLEGVWTPLLNMKMGYCELNCVLCGQVCPTGAIQRIAIEEKLGLGEHARHGPIHIGTAFIDRGRCLPWAMDTPCVVCQEVCPTSPKAIFTREVILTGRDGKPLVLAQPYVDPNLCIGCGICEHECPVKDEAAVRVTAIGETRSRERRLLLESAGDARPEN